MQKKTIWFVAMLVLLIGVFAMTETAYAADPVFGDYFGLTWEVKTLQTPYYHGRLNMWPPIPAVYKMGSISSGQSFNDYQRHTVSPVPYLDNCLEEVDSYVRVRLQANGEMSDYWVDPFPNILEGNMAVKIWLDKPGKPEVASGVSNEFGVVDIVGMIPAGETYGVTVGAIGAFQPVSNIIGPPFDWMFEFDVWITQGDEPGGGVIVDFREDLQGTATNRSIQFSTQEGVEPDEAYWAHEPFAFSDSIPDWGAAQYWLDIPTGTYNLGVQQTNEIDPVEAGARPGDPFVHYVPNIPVGPNAFFGPLGWDFANMEWIEGSTIFARLGATEPLMVEIDKCGPYVGEVFLNVVDGFLVDDLSPGWIHGDPYTPNGLGFLINKGFTWDLAVVTDEVAEHHDHEQGFYDNWFLVSLSFNAAAGDLVFDLCKTGAQYITPTLDKDWDSADLYLTPPGGNLNERMFDIDDGYTRFDRPYSAATFPYPYNPADPPLPRSPGTRQYESENVFVYAKAGCCGETGCFEALVELDNDEWNPRNCCTTQVTVPVGTELCGQKNTEYGFIPKEPCWDFPLVDISEWYTCTLDPWLCVQKSYDPIFGDGPFQTSPDLATTEFDVTELNGEVLLPRGPWTDADGNQIVYILEDDRCVDLCASDCCDEGDDFDRYRYTKKSLMPYYLLEDPTGKVTLLDESWDITPLGPITEIGRYKFWRAIPHGYLGDIEGHEAWRAVCCDITGPCEICPDDCEYELDICELDHYVDFDNVIFAISPADTPMAHWSWSWVMALYEWDLTTGLTPTTFGPDVDMQRAEMAAFLSRVLDLLGVPAKGTAAPFDDTVGHWAEPYILHLRDYKITDGVGGNLYDPDKVVSRAEMAKFIQLTFRAVNTYQPGTIKHWDTNQNVFHPGSAFVDVPSNHWAHFWVEEMLFDGLTSGYTYDQGNWYFMPDMPVTRGQMAKFVMSAIQTDEATQAFWPVLAPEK